MICAAFVSNNWRRAEITKLPGNGNVEVFTLDFGNTDIIPWNKIRKLHNDFVAFDAQAIRVSLIDITPINKGNWTIDACNYFMKYTKDKVLRMIVQHPAITELDIILYEEKEELDICINALLVRDKYASSTGESSKIVEFHKVVPINEENMIKYNTCHTESRLPVFLSKCNELGNEMKIVKSQLELPGTVKEPAFRKTVVLINIESPDCFYVTLPEWISLRNKLMKDMKQYYNLAKPSKVNWKINDKCAVLSINGNAWYRGIIIDTENKNFKVFLKDIALKEDLPINNIYLLDDQFLGIRDLAIRCSLAGIIPAGGSNKWTHMAIEKFQELGNMHHDLYITKQGDIINKSLPVYFYATWEEIGGPLEPSTQRQLLLNKCLVDQGVALPAKGISFDEYSEQNPFENDPFDSSSALTLSTSEIVDKIPEHWLSPLPFSEKRFKGKPTYVDHGGYVYLHSLQMENNLKQMKRLLNNNFLKTPPDPDHSWFPGQMCTVQYYLDKTYYRATILDTKMDGKILVQFIDYGNEEETTHSDLRTEVMLIDEPAMATKCKLFNVKPLTSSGKWPIPLLDKLHATIVDQEVDVEVIGKQVDNEPVNVILTFNKININLQVMSADWCKEEQEEIKGTIIEDDENYDVIIDGIIDESDTSDDKIGDWVSMANLEQLNEVKYQYIGLPKKFKTFEVVVINVLEYNTLIIEGSFNIHLIKSTEEQFDELSKDMNENGPKQPPIFEPTIGQACCTEYSEDKNWYRAEIYSVDMLDKKGQVEVLFVDYGNLELVPRENIRMLRKEWVEFPVQQLKCKIFGIEMGDHIDSQEACKYMSELLLEKRLLLIIKNTEPILEASFLDLDSTDLAYKKAIDDGILICNLLIT